jgi:hypothetical protein
MINPAPLGVASRYVGLKARLQPCKTLKKMEMKNEYRNKIRVCISNCRIVIANCEAVKQSRKILKITPDCFRPPLGVASRYAGLKARLQPCKTLKKTEM